MGAPKVTIREVQSGPNTVVGVGTSIAGFVGLADKGPIGEAKLITSFAQFEDTYGGFRSDSYLAYAVLGFFQNGGAACYIVRTGHYSNIAAGELDASANVKASRTFADRGSSPQNTFKVSALSESELGNDISITISRASNEPASFVKVFGNDGGVFSDNSLAARSAALYKAFSDDSGSFSDRTADANTAGGGSAFNIFSASPGVDDAFYVASKEKTFSKVYMSISTAADTAGVAQLEYWNGSSWQAITPTTDEITSSGITFGAAAGDDKLVEFAAPSDWQRVEVNSVLAYWIRFRVTSAFTGTAPQLDRVSLSEDRPFGAFTPVASATVETAAATALNDAMYIGSTTQFSYADLGVLTPGDSSGVITWEYWNGTSWAALSDITETAANAKNFRASGIVGWDLPNNWAKTSVNSSSSLYYVRARISTNYSSAYPALDHCLPASDLFKVQVKDAGVLVEEFDNIQLSDSSLSSFAETAIGTPSAPVSAYITADVLSSTNVAPNNRPIEIIDAKLSGGIYSTTGITDIDYIGSEASLSGLYALPDEVSMVAVPGINTEAVHNSMLAYCENKMDRMAILDSTGDSILDTPSSVVEYVRDTAALNSSYGAIYDFWLFIADPVTGAKKIVPPSGHIAGMYARTDEQRGVWKAPAGIQDGRLFGALDVVYNTNQAERDLIYDNKINPIRNQAGLGVYVDGSINLAPLGTDFDRISIRRMFMFVEESLQDASEAFKHEPIDSRLFDRMRGTYGAFLLDLWRKGGLKGDRPSDAFFIQVDDSNNPPSSVAKRQVNVRIGLAVLQPAEFITLEFQVDKRALLNELASAGL